MTTANKKSPRLDYAKGARVKVTRRTGEVVTGCKFLNLIETPTGHFIRVSMPGMAEPYDARPVKVKAY